MSYEHCEKHNMEATNGCEKCEQETVNEMAHMVAITITYMPRPMIGLEEKLRKADSRFLERLLAYLAAP
jgi:hypothetical protein